MCRSGIPGPCSSSIFSFLMTCYSFYSGHTSLHSQSSIPMIIYLFSIFLCFFFLNFFIFENFIHACSEISSYMPPIYSLGELNSLLNLSLLLLFSPSSSSSLPPSSSFSFFDKPLSLVSVAHKFMGMGPSTGGWKT